MKEVLDEAVDRLVVRSAPGCGKYDETTDVFDNAKGFEYDVEMD